MSRKRKALLAVSLAALAVSGISFLGTLFAPAVSAGALESASVYEAATTTLVYGEPIRITRVIDGDTVELQGGARLRYIGIDTPEEFKPNTPVQCYAKEAADENRRLVEGKEVTIYKDVSAVDIYGRYLGFVYLPDGTFVNDLLVKEGYAFAYPYKPDTSKSALFAASEKAAKAAALGLWSACAPYKESSGREQTNAL
jgi:micrococcal nuclease